MSTKTITENFRITGMIEQNISKFMVYNQKYEMSKKEIYEWGLDGQSICEVKLRDNIDITFKIVEEKNKPDIQVYFDDVLVGYVKPNERKHFLEFYKKKVLKTNANVFFGRYKRVFVNYNYEKDRDELELIRDRYDCYWGEVELTFNQTPKTRQLSESHFLKKNRVPLDMDDIEDHKVEDKILKYINIIAKRTCKNVSIEEPRRNKECLSFTVYGPKYGVDFKIHFGKNRKWIFITPDKNLSKSVSEDMFFDKELNRYLIPPDGKIDYLEEIIKETLRHNDNIFPVELSDSYKTKMNECLDVIFSIINDNVQDISSVFYDVKISSETNAYVRIETKRNIIDKKYNYKTERIANIYLDLTKTLLKITLYHNKIRNKNKELFTIKEDQYNVAYIYKFKEPEDILIIQKEIIKDIENQLK